MSKISACMHAMLELQKNKEDVMTFAWFISVGRRAVKAMGLGTVVFAMLGMPSSIAAEDKSVGVTPNELKVFLEEKFGERALVSSGFLNGTDENGVSFNVVIGVDQSMTLAIAPLGSGLSPQWGKCRSQVLAVVDRHPYYDSWCADSLNQYEAKKQVEYQLPNGDFWWLGSEYMDCDHQPDEDQMPEIVKDIVC